MNFRRIRSQFKNYLKLYKALYKDKRTSLLAKILLGLALGYAFMPFDLIPDFIPVIGHLDDLIIIPGLIYLALRLIPTSLYEEHRKLIFED